MEFGHKKVVRGKLLERGRVGWGGVVGQREGDDFILPAYSLWLTVNEKKKNDLIVADSFAT